MLPDFGPAKIARPEAAIAHSSNGHGQRHDLIAHLRAVAEESARFADHFGGGALARYVGLWHDVGKFDPSFQAYLLDCETGNAPRRGPDHKSAGARIALEHRPELALLIQGHHGGLRSPADFKSWLASTTGTGPDAAAGEARRVIPDLAPPTTLAISQDLSEDLLGQEMFLRLLFSALVDADYLDTERHFDEHRATQRPQPVPMEELWRRFQEARGQLRPGPNDELSAIREHVNVACQGAASEPPGLFRLSVPTGGGKTLSGMAFALRHALAHGFQRVVVAVPFITITEQTADVYRRVFERDGDSFLTVLEHHSGVALEVDDDGFAPDAVKRRLVSENWDAPIVITTTVQLFESLFASSTSRCRKVHRLAGSVIILDEAQALPAHLLETILDGLRSLCTHFRTTVVLSTATQPAFDALPPFAKLDAREIVPEPGRLFQAARRVRYEWRTEKTSSWAEIGSLLRDESQALAIVNTKRDALDLLDALADPDAMHLSTMLCGAHRRDVIADVRARLEASEPCRLVATQVVEAGVDIDFPLVLRALGPLDAIIQAAGRCNREGRAEFGRVVIVRPEGAGTPPGAYRTATDVTQVLLADGLDPDDPSDARRYYEALYPLVDTDTEDIAGLRRRLEFAEVARRFRMIKDDTESVVVPYGSDSARARVVRDLALLRKTTPSARMTLRRLQPYVISVRSRQADEHRRRGLISEVLPGLGEWLGSYDAVRGLTGKGIDPEALIV